MFVLLLNVCSLLFAVVNVLQECRWVLSRAWRLLFLHHAVLWLTVLQTQHLKVSQRWQLKARMCWFTNDLSKPARLYKQPFKLWRGNWLRTTQQAGKLYFMCVSVCLLFSKRSTKQLESIRGNSLFWKDSLADGPIMNGRPLGSLLGNLALSIST